MTQELLPCPFCGSSARVETEIDDDGFDVADEPERWVQCENRDCRGRSDWSYDPDMAVKWWNTRPSAQAVAVDIQFAGMMINTIHIPEGYCMDLSERGVLRIVKQQQPQGEK